MSNQLHCFFLRTVPSPTLLRPFSSPKGSWCLRSWKQCLHWYRWWQGWTWMACLCHSPWQFLSSLCRTDLLFLKIICRTDLSMIWSESEYTGFHALMGGRQTVLLLTLSNFINYIWVLTIWNRWASANFGLVLSNPATLFLK